MIDAAKRTGKILMPGTQHRSSAHIAEATRMIQEYKQKHGKVDDKIKKDLQVWYNKDKGKQIEKEMISLLSLIIEG